MKKQFLLNILTGTLCILLCSCSSLFDKDNTPPPSPLVNFNSEIKVHETWSTHANKGISNDYTKLVPTINGPYIFTASQDGSVSATDKSNGKSVWSSHTGLEISAGPAAHGNLVFVGSHNGEVIALKQTDGNQLWKINVPGEIIATPAANNNIVLIKTIDGHLHALSTQEGHVLWNYEQPEPTLILSRSSAPLIDGNIAIVGFANGNLSKLTLNEGSLLWQQTVGIPKGTFAIQRMVDIDADPITYNRKIYVATYQGRIASFDFTTGNILWSHDISSYTGIAADANKIYVSDAKSHLWAFNAQNGNVLWHQTQLEARNITGPVTMGNYIVVGDAEGYLHWLSKQDGHFVARTKVDNSGIIATPIMDYDILYVMTREGTLAAYTISS